MQRAWEIQRATISTTQENQRVEIAQLRRKVSQCAGHPFVLVCHQDPVSLDFAARDDLEVLSQQGPATPDHVIRTKRIPLIGRDIDTYAAAYRAYFDANVPLSNDALTMLDPAPRVIVDKELGLCTVGASVKDADIVADIYRHTIDVILRATALDRYQALPTEDLFAVEYWELEQAKLKKGGTLLMFAGEIALVTGAASGIGKACVEAFLERGAAVIGLDINAAIVGVLNRPDFLGIACDVTDEGQLSAALEQGVRRFGGLDMLVLNAGVFPGGCAIAELDLAQWNRVMTVNLDANLSLMRESYPLLKLAPNYGRVVVVGSKNVPAPGPGAAAYSASKSALNQLARVAALEWGADGIRVNTLHPDAVFDTGIWTDDVIASRAKQYGMSVDEYKTKNILKTEIGSRDVAQLVVELCSLVFAKTTGTQIPIDGGNDRVI